MRVFFTASLLILFIGIYNCTAQKKEYEIGAMIGATTYWGELNQNNVFHQVRPGLQAFYRYLFHDQLALRANLNFLVLSGLDEKSEFIYNMQRDFEFTSNMLELSSVLELNFRPFNATNKRTVSTPYFSIGFGMSLVNGKFVDKVSNNITIPFGIGYKMNMAGRWSAGIEYKIHKTFRDDLDKLNTQLFAEDGKYPYKQIANLRNDDWFSYFGFYFAYRFRRNEHCCAYS